MDKFLEALQANVNIDSEVVAEYAKWMFYKEVSADIAIVLVFVTLGVVAYNITKNFGTGKWK